MTETLRLRAGMAWVLSAVLLTGCATAHVINVPSATSDVPCLVATPEPDVLIGVALSGGGSRAALFGAAGLEAVSGLRTAAGTSVMEQVTYLSSVSGGSLAASYYTLNKPARDVKVLTPEGAMTSAYRAFFDEYRRTLSQDFQTSLLWRQLVSFRWVNPALAAMTLAEVLRHNLLGEATMMDLSRRQAMGDAPRLIINTTLYNNGRRLAVTNLPSEAFRYDFFQDLRQSLAQQGKPAQMPSPLVKRYESLIPVTPLEMGMDPCPIRLAGSVTASASFPPLVGPFTFQVAGSDTYWHVGDGGLYENQGAESLLFLFLKQLQERKARRALLLAFDSSFPFRGGGQATQRARAAVLPVHLRLLADPEHHGGARHDLSGALLSQLADGGGVPRREHSPGHPASPHRGGVASRSERSAAGVPRRDFPEDPGRGGGAHRRDPDPLASGVGVRPAVAGHRRHQAGGRSTGRGFSTFSRGARLGPGSLKERSAAGTSGDGAPVDAPAAQRRPSAEEDAFGGRARSASRTLGKHRLGDRPVTGIGEVHAVREPGARLGPLNTAVKS